jgi:hypothetical protein
MSFEEMDRQEANWQARARAAQGGAAQAFARLLVLAETRDTGQARRIAKFLASCYNGQAYPFDVFELSVSLGGCGLRLLLRPKNNLQIDPIGQVGRFVSSCDGNHEAIFIF